MQTEKEMREAKPPRCETSEELLAYIESLVNREHDYGTCVYAMSHAAVAAFNFVAGKLGVTGFQAGCADMDILRHTRHLEWGRIQDFQNLLYPQYEGHFDGWDSLLRANANELAKRAKKLIADSGSNVAPAVMAHWKRLAKTEESK